MSIKRCALCKKTAYTSNRGNNNEYWVCSDCRLKAVDTLENNIQTEKPLLPVESICNKCKKRSEGCRFSETERSKIKACSDWEGKKSRHNLRRWAKFED